MRNHIGNIGLANIEADSNTVGPGRRTEGAPRLMPVGDARFFARSGSHPLAEVAIAAGAGAPPAALTLTGVAPLQTAGPTEVSFLDNRRYAAALERTAAGAVIVHPEMVPRVPVGTIPLITSRPYEAWARVAALFHPAVVPSPGIHATAVVNTEARIDPGAEISAFCIIEAGADIGPGCRLGPYVHVGRGVSIGAEGRIGAHASLSHAIIGARVYAYPGGEDRTGGLRLRVHRNRFLDDTPARTGHHRR